MVYFFSQGGLYLDLGLIGQGWFASAVILQFADSRDYTTRSLPATSNVLRARGLDLRRKFNARYQPSESNPVHKAAQEYRPKTLDTILVGGVAR